MMRSAAEVSLSRITTLVRNGRRTMTVSDTQPNSFFDHGRSLTATQRRTSVNGMQIFSPDPDKVCLVSMDTTIGYSRDLARVKVVTVSPRDLFPMDT